MILYICLDQLPLSSPPGLHSPELQHSQDEAERPQLTANAPCAGCWLLCGSVNITSAPTQQQKLQQHKPGGETKRLLFMLCRCAKAERMQSVRSRACLASTNGAGQQMQRVAAEPQDQAGAGSVSPLMGPLPLPGGPTQLVGVEEGVPCAAVKQVWQCLLL